MNVLLPPNAALATIRAHGITSPGRARRAPCAIRPTLLPSSSTTSRSASGSSGRCAARGFRFTTGRDSRSHRPERLGKNDAVRVPRRRFARHARHGDATAASRSSRPARKDHLYFVPDGIRPWPDQTVGWVLRFIAGMHGVAGVSRRRRARARLHSSRCAARGSTNCPRASIGACCSRLACSRRTRC